MKNKFLPVLTFFAIFSVFIFSCRKEISNLINGQSTAIDAAKSWYEANQGMSVYLKSTVVESGKLYAKPAWEHAYKSDHDTFTTVEVPISLQGRFCFASEDCRQAYVETGDERYVNSLTYMVVQTDKKSKNTMGFLMTIIPDKVFRVSTGFKSFSSQYLKWQNNFSGYIFYHTLNGDFANGWQLLNGEVIKMITPNQDNGIGIQLKSTPQCYAITVNTLYMDCVQWYTVFENADGSYGIGALNGIPNCGSTFTYLVGSYYSCDTTPTKAYYPPSPPLGSGIYNPGLSSTLSKLGMPSTMVIQSGNNSVTACMEYINKNFCGGSTTMAVYNLDYYNTYNSDVPTYGVSVSNIYGFVSTYFRVGTFSGGFTAAINGGRVVMTDVLSDYITPVHCVVVLGYHPTNGSLIFMDPVMGKFMEAAPSIFPLDYTISIGSCK